MNHSKEVSYTMDFLDQTLDEYILHNELNNCEKISLVYSLLKSVNSIHEKILFIEIYSLKIYMLKKKI